MTSPTRPANYSLDVNGFRGVCVALVFLHHVANSGLPPAADAESWLQALGRDLFMSFGYGVELFFMISGYVIVNSLRRHATAASFLRDRALRIFPVWLPICAVLCVGSVLAHRPGFDANAPYGWLAACVANLALLPPLVPVSLAHPASWSLTYEWVFYLMAAVGAILWRRDRAPVLPRLLWLFVAGLWIAAFPRALFFLVGVWVAMAPQSLVGATRLGARAPWLVWSALPVFLLAWYGTGIFAAQYSVPLWEVLAQGHQTGVIVAFVAGLFLFANIAAPAGQGTVVLRTRAVQHLGTISYSFYLVHPLAMAAVKFALLKAMPDAAGEWSSTLAFAVVSALVAWALSWLSWRWLEQGVGRWLKARAMPRAPAAKAPSFT